MGNKLSFIQMFEKYNVKPNFNPLFEEVSFNDVAMGLGTRFKNIIAMVGAGISVNSGIPDFRSPKTGLYSRIPFGENVECTKKPTIALLYSKCGWSGNESWDSKLSYN